MRKMVNRTYIRSELDVRSTDIVNSEADTEMYADGFKIHNKKRYNLKITMNDFRVWIFNSVANYRINVYGDIIITEKEQTNQVTVIRRDSYVSVAKTETELTDAEYHAMLNDNLL